MNPETPNPTSSNRMESLKTKFQGHLEDARLMVTPYSLSAVLIGGGLAVFIGGSLLRLPLIAFPGALIVMAGFVLVNLDGYEEEARLKAEADASLNVEPHAEPDAIAPEDSEVQR